MAENKAVVPWGLHPLPKWVYKEMQRRGQEYGQNVDVSLPDKPYSGPRTAWVRFFSNGKSKMPGAEKMDGFVLGGVYDFNESFGFTNDGFLTIGVDARGNPHRIPNDTAVSTTKTGRLAFSSDYPHRPPPTIESLTCEMAGATTGFPNACRKVTVNWKCNSLAQLNYMAPYFLNPRITCLAEWGWNNYDPISLVDLTDLDWMNNMFTDPSYTLEYLEQSNGNYDAGLGFIVDYGIKMNDAGGYDCFTTLINANRLVEGEQLHNQSKTMKKGNDEIPLKSFKEFAKKDLQNIDLPKSAELRKKLKIGTKIYDPESNPGAYVKDVLFVVDDIADRSLRITKDDSGENKPGLWLRMDVIQDIINAFFQITMDNPQQAIIRSWDIEETLISASPFLKATGKDMKVLVPNQFAPRFIFQDKDKPSVTVEDGKYASLFKTKADKVTAEYRLDPVKFDNLQEAINPTGKSFPVYEDSDIMDPTYPDEVLLTLRGGYYGYLKDLFISADYFAKLVDENSSLLKLIEHLLQTINESLCQICQLKLIPAEYGNAKYSVYDENLAVVSTDKDAATLSRISIGSVKNNGIKSISFDVKISSEMMNQLVFQSANPDTENADGAITSKNVKADPISSRYSAGDRLYERGIIETAVASDLTPEQQKAQADTLKAEKEAADRLKKEEAEALKKKQLERSDAKFKKEKCIYYKKNAKKELMKYYICEPENDFMNYVLSMPDSNATYLNNAIMPSTTLTLELLGISGVNYLSQFTIDHAPEAYCYRNAVWQISDIKQSVSDKSWTTTLTAQVRPLTVLT